MLGLESGEAKARLQSKHRLKKAMARNNEGAMILTTKLVTLIF